MFRNQLARITSRRTALHYKPRAPKIEREDLTAKVAPDTKAAAATSIVNGVRGVPVFPQGTLLSTFKERLPLMAGGLVSILVVFGWPAAIVIISDKLNDVPSIYDTAMVQKTAEGYICEEIKPAGLDASSDDE